MGARRSWAGLIVVAMFVLAGCGGSGSEAKTGDLFGNIVDPPFVVAGTELTDSEGEPYSLAETEKRLTLVFFGYTHCPDICGIVMSNLAAAMTRLDERDRDEVEVVFVTTDPERDTGKALRRYLDHVDKNFIGLTGEIEDIAGVARSVAVGMGDPLPTGGYDVDTHTTQVTGIDTAGEAPIYWNQDTSPQQFANDIHILLGGS